MGDGSADRRTGSLPLVGALAMLLEGLDNGRGGQPLCTNSGNVGTSNYSRSPLPAQFRNGPFSFFSSASASRIPATRSSASRQAPRSSRVSGESCGEGSAAAASTQAEQKSGGLPCRIGVPVGRGREAAV